MQTPLRVILCFVIVGSLIAVGISVWPGVLIGLLKIALLLSVIWLPPAILVVVVVSIRFRKSLLSRSLLIEMSAIPCVVIFTLILLFFYVPRRVVFLGCRPYFEAAVPGAPKSEHGLPFGERLGVYQVDERAVDPRGGAFFRVYSGPDGIGPDTMSYGFVKRPNRTGTPFGAARYAVYHLVDDWYWFRASDDSY